MSWYSVFAILLYAVISPSTCCISFRSGAGCSPLSYGGRLMIGGDASHLSNQLLFGPEGRKRIFIFQQPPERLGRRWSQTKFILGSSGRGRIWASNEQCRRPQSGQSLCPMSVGSPCLDSKKPCDTAPPSFTREDPLSFTVKTTSIYVEWPSWDEEDDLGFGPVTTYIILYREKGESKFKAIRKQNTFEHSFEGLEPNTQYEFRLILERDHPDGAGQPSNIQLIRTEQEGTKDTGDGKTVDIETGEKKELTGTAGNGSGKLKVIVNTTIEGYSPVGNLTAYPNDVGQLNLTWEPPEIDTNYYRTVGYVVTYVLQEHGACSQNVGLWRNISVNDTRVILTGLEDYAIYKISVTPRTVFIKSKAEGYGITSSIVQRTLPSGPEAALEPDQVLLPSPSATTLKFSWNRVPCEDQNGPNFIYNCVLYILTDGKQPERFTEVNVTQESHVFTDLIPCGRYTLEVTPQNQMHSGTTETTTSEARTSSAPFKVVGDVSFIQHRETGHVTVKWQPPRDNVCPVASYTLTTKLQKQQACHECVDEEENVITDIRDTSYVLDNLLPYATYIVSVKPNGNDVLMNGVPLETVLTTTKRAPAEPTTVMVDDESITQTSLKFTWDPVSCKGLNGLFMQYSYSLHHPNTDVISEEGSIRESSSRSITFTDLAPCTNYTFNMRVDNDAFYGMYNTIYARTYPAAPQDGVKLNLNLNTIDTCIDGNACLIATWKTPALSSGCLPEYQRISLHQLDVDNCRDTSRKLVSSPDLDVDQLEHVFTGLKPNSMYRATLVVGNSIETVTAVRKRRTPESAPSGAPQNVEAQRPIRGRRLNITWDEPECGHRNGDILKYEYKLYQENQEIRSGITPKKWHYFENLERGTPYSFTVRAYTKLGPGPYYISETGGRLEFTTHI